MKIQTHNQGFDILELSQKTGEFGSSLMGYIDISYAELVAKFGKPLAGCDKIDAMWELTDGGRAATIYNYKDGRTYCGRNGKPTKNIRDWHIGGFNQSAVEMLRDVFPDHHVKGSDW